MELKVPVHVFEIRFPFLLGSHKEIRKILSPYMQMVTRVNFQKENTVEEKITLMFEDDSYAVIASWNRLAFRYEGDITSLSESNSAIENPFFEIYSKIKDLDSFTSPSNFLFYAMFVKVSENRKEKQIVETMNQSFLTDQSRKLLANVSDIGIVLEDEGDKHKTKLTFGPFKGSEDLDNRKVEINRKENLLLYESVGEMIEFNHLERIKDVTFRDYKEVVKKSNQIINRLWEN